MVTGRLTDAHALRVINVPLATTLPQPTCYVGTCVKAVILMFLYFSQLKGNHCVDVSSGVKNQIAWVIINCGALFPHYYFQDIILQSV